MENEQPDPRAVWIKEHVELELAASTIARRHGVSEERVRKALIEEGIYVRRKGHTPVLPEYIDKPAFLANVNTTPGHGPNQDCHLWEGPKLRKHGVETYGYTCLRGSGKPVPAHRVALVLAGFEALPGLVAAHECDHKLCVNPEHLRFVSAAENARESSQRIGGGRKVSVVDRLVIEELAVRGVSRSVINAMFGVSVSTVDGVINGTWLRWVPRLSNLRSGASPWADVIAAVEQDALLDEEQLALLRREGVTAIGLLADARMADLDRDE